MTRRVVVVPDADAVARVTASRLLVTIIDAQSDHSPVHIGLTGGSLGIATLAAIAANPLIHLVDWASVHIWWSDERFLPSGDPERNETGARTAFLDALADQLPTQNIHPIPGPSDVPDPETAAAIYETDLASYAASGETVPQFDVLLLGIGPDGHIASLFPGHPETSQTGRSVIAVHNSPKPPSDRVSFTFTTIAAAAEVWFVAAGTAKAERIAAALAGAAPTDVPAAGASGRSRTLWLLDTAAAG